MRGLALAAAVVGVAGCYSIDIVSPTKNLPPSVVMSLSVIHDAMTSYRVDVFYTRGTGADGGPRPMEDSILLVNDDAVTPFARGVLRNLEYSYTGSVPAGTPETLFVRLPIAADVSAPATFALPIPARPDPYLVELVEGTDLTLVLPAPAGEPPITGSANWQLDVARAAGSVFRIQGSTEPPPALVVAASLLPVSAGDTLTAGYSRSVVREPGAALPFPVRIFEFVQVSWRIPVIAAP